LLIFLKGQPGPEAVGTGRMCPGGTSGFERIIPLMANNINELRPKDGDFRSLSRNCNIGLRSGLNALC
jgi:hypothetical protein